MHKIQESFNYPRETVVYFLSLFFLLSSKSHGFVVDIHACVINEVSFQNCDKMHVT